MIHMSLDIIYICLGLVLTLISWLNSIFESYRIHSIIFPFDIIAFSIYEISKDIGQIHPKLSEGFVLVLLLKRFLSSRYGSATPPIIDDVIISFVWPSKAFGYMISCLILAYNLYMHAEYYSKTWMNDGFQVAVILVFITLFKYVGDVFLLLKKADSDIMIILHCYAILYVIHREGVDSKGLYDQQEEALAFTVYLYVFTFAFGISILTWGSSIKYVNGSQLIVTICAAIYLIKLTYNGAILKDILVIFRRISSLLQWMIFDILLADECSRLIVCILWISCMVLLIPLAYETTKNEHVLLARKTFHIIAVLMFMPVTLFFPDFMLMAYSVSLSSIILIEFVRVYLQSYSNNWMFFIRNKIELFYSRFLDDRDRSRGMILSHCHLILGCAIPLLYLTAIEIISGGTLTYRNRIIRHFGWITVGIGDTVGAVVGIKYGKRRWIGSRKTLEGSGGALLTMIIVSILTMMIEAWMDKVQIHLVDIGALIVVMSVACVAEVLTGENDNLIMPLIACISFSIMTF